MQIDIKTIDCVSPKRIKLLDMTPESARTLLSRYEKKGIFTRVKRGYYVNNTIEIDLQQVSNVLFNGSYVSLDTVLYKEGVIKQFSKTIYRVSNTGKFEEIQLGDYTAYKYTLSIPSEIGTYYANDGSWRATKERALLDSLYLKLFSKKYPGDSEYNFARIDDSEIDKIITFYPERVRNYYVKLRNEQRTTK